MAYLDKDGLRRLWEKIKGIVPTKTSELTNDSGFLTEHQDISGKQDTLVNGENIKTINNKSILGSGNIVIEGGGDVTGDTLPIGFIGWYPSATAPTNWLPCDGRAVSRTTYAELFAVLGTSHGAGDGSTTFNLPNIKARTIVGYDSSDTDFNAIGKTSGNKTHNHQYGISYMSNNGIILGDDSLGNDIIGLLHNGTTMKPSGIYSSSTTKTLRFADDTRANMATYTYINTANTSSNSNIQPSITEYPIIKAFQSAGVVAEVENTESESTTNVYSCDYTNAELNKKFDKNNLKTTETSSDTNTYSCNYVNGKLGELLYNNSSGTTSTVNLSKNVNNYWCLEIFYKTNDSGSSSSVRITDVAYGDKIASLLYTWYVDGNVYFKQANAYVSGNTIRFQNNVQWSLQTGVTSGSYIYITKVVGYK